MMLEILNNVYLIIFLNLLTQITLKFLFFLYFYLFILSFLLPTKTIFYTLSLISMINDRNYYIYKEFALCHLSITKIMSLDTNTNLIVGHLT